MTQPQTETTAPTWIKVAIVILLVLSLWALFAARSAGSTAAANEARARVADVGLTLVAGGPERFAEAFEEAVGDADADDLDAGAYVWTSLLVRNEGAADAQEVTVEADVLSADSAQVLGQMAGFQDLEVEIADGTLELSLGDVDTGETATVFLGFEPGALPEGLEAAWAADHALVVDTVSAFVDGADDPTATLYGAAL